MDKWGHELQWNAIAYAIVAGAAAASLVGMWAFVPMLRQRWLPLARLRPGNWHGHEVLLVFAIVFGAPLILVATLFQIGFFTPLIGPPALDEAGTEVVVYLQRCTNIASPLIVAVALGVLFAVLYARTGTRPHHFGVSWSRWPLHVALGMIAFLIALPIVLGIHAVATLIEPAREHSFVTLGQQELFVWEWALLAFQATVAAPFLEEIAWRGILQGWLRRASRLGHVAFLSLTLFFAVKDLVAYDSEQKIPVFDTQKIAPAVFGLLLVVGYGFCMYRLARRFDLNAQEFFDWMPDQSLSSQAAETEERRQAREQAQGRARQWLEANARLAMFGSAMFFAIVHAAWPAPIPLFVLGLILAWLTQRTQSLIPAITLHALFNLVAFIALYGSVMTAPLKNGNADTTAVRPSLFGSITTSVPASQLPLRK